MMKAQIWIGLIGIVPIEGNNSLGEKAGGAYTNALGYADDYDEFVAYITNDIKAQGFEMFEIEDVELFSDRISKYQVDKEIKELAQEVELTKEYRYGTFYTFPAKDVN